MLEGPFSIHSAYFALSTTGKIDRYIFLLSLCDYGAGFLKSSAAGDLAGSPGARSILPDASDAD